MASKDTFSTREAHLHLHLCFHLYLCLFLHIGGKVGEKKPCLFKQPQTQHTNTHTAGHILQLCLSPSSLSLKEESTNLFSTYVPCTHTSSLLCHFGGHKLKSSQNPLLWRGSPQMFQASWHTLRCPHCMKDLLNHHIIPRGEGLTTRLRWLAV